MRNNRSSKVFVAMRRFAALASVMLAPAPALAQYIGGAPPPLPSAPAPGEIQTPAGTLARAVRILARIPRDFTALITAGRAALDLGDTQAAIGFFGRAEEVRPSDPAPKIGMGAATVATGDADGALRWFFEAQRLGATGVSLGADRGLAQDLLGNQASAQVDYRAALGGREADEARRRLALSLGISGNRTEAFTALQPLLLRRDPAAQRIRAFVLALVGDERGASDAIDQAMPGTGLRMAGFFRLLPTLSASQKAAAVHLGVFPDPSEIRVAAVSPRSVTLQSAPRREQRVEVVIPPRDRPIVDAPERPATTVSAPPPRLAESIAAQRFAGSSFEATRSNAGSRAVPPVADPRPLPLPPPATVTAPISAVPQPILTQTAPVAIASTPPEASAAAGQPGPASTTTAATATATLELPAGEPTTATSLADSVALASAAASTSAEPAAANSSPPASSLVPVAGDRLSGIDRLLAQADELPVPPAPTPRFEQRVKLAAVNAAKTSKAAELKKAADAKKAADLKKAKAEEEQRDSIGLSGTNWVQLAGGSHPERMGAEFRRLGAKSAALKKRGAAVTAGKDYFRLLTGPFATKSAAQDFVNQLAKDGVDGFSWTRTPATLKIEKLSPK